jgi:hypothetical protein
VELSSLAFPSLSDYGGFASLVILAFKGTSVDLPWNSFINHRYLFSYKNNEPAYLIFS